MPRTRSGEPIHRNSRARGSFEAGFFRSIAPAKARLLQLAAERYDRKNKKSGARCGPLGHVAHEVLGLFLRLQQSSPDGRLEPSYQWIRQTLRRSIDAIWRALRRLEAAGLLEWERRVERDPASWQWHQKSNAYRVLIPRWFVASLPVVDQPAPTPDDFDHAIAAATDARLAQERGLPPEEYAGHVVQEPGLAGALSRLGRAFQRSHDSAERSESLPVISLRDESGVALSGDNMNGSGAPAAPDRLGGGWTARPVPS